MKTPIPEKIKPMRDNDFLLEYLEKMREQNSALIDVVTEMREENDLLKGTANYVLSKLSMAEQTIKNMNNKPYTAMRSTGESYCECKKPEVEKYFNKNKICFKCGLPVKSQEDFEKKIVTLLEEYMSNYTAQIEAKKILAIVKGE